jgi:hypothetical protein
MNRKELQELRFKVRQQRDKQEKDLREIKLQVDTCQAVIVQTIMLELAQKDRKITGFSFEAEYEYDDEGGYYWSPTYYAAGMEELEDWEFQELVRDEGLDESQVMLAFECSSTSEGEISVADLRAAWKGKSVKV